MKAMRSNRAGRARPGRRTIAGLAVAALAALLLTGCSVPKSQVPAGNVTPGPLESNGPISWSEAASRVGAPASTLLILARACGERTNAARVSPGRTTSSVYCLWPVIKRKSSLRRTAAPIPVALMAVSSRCIFFAPRRQFYSAAWRTPPLAIAFAPAAMALTML